jgi:hypothetical protein
MGLHGPGEFLRVLSMAQHTCPHVVREPQRSASSAAISGFEQWFRSAGSISGFDQ